MERVTWNLRQVTLLTARINTIQDFLAACQKSILYKQQLTEKRRYSLFAKFIYLSSRYEVDNHSEFMRKRAHPASYVVSALKYGPSNALHVWDFKTGTRKLLAESW